MSIDIFQREIAFGIVPFETIYFEESIPQYIEDHYKRLKRCCKVFNVNLDISLQEFNYFINKYIESSGKINGALKASVLNSEINFNIREISYTKEMYKRGLSLSISKSIRDYNNIFNFFKTYNYGINYIEDMRAKKSGYDSCIFLNKDDYICETSYANIFFKKGDNIYTPHISCGLLNGIMRHKTIGYAKYMGYEVKKDYISIKDIHDFDECFITNSICGVFPVFKINNVLFKSDNFSKQIIRVKEFKRLWNFWN